AFQEEDFSPPANVLKWRVDFYYGTDKMNKPQEFWKNEGKYWNRDISKFAVHSPVVTAGGNQTVGGTDTPEQKARKIYAFAQKIRNLNYTSEEGGMEELISRKRKEKRTADDLLNEHEGYRDEIARLFVDMAQAAGVPAFLMRVADRDEYFFQAAVPNRAQLTSEIAVVTLDGKDVFLDPGTPLCPFGLLAWQHTSTQGIRQTAGGGTELAPTAVANYKDALSKRVGWITLSEDGSAKGKMGVAWAGEEAVVRRLNGMKTDATGQKKDLEDELRRALPDGSIVELTSMRGWNDSEAQLTASFNVEIPAYGSNAGKRMLVPQDMFQTPNHQ